MSRRSRPRGGGKSPSPARPSRNGPSSRNGGNGNGRAHAAGNGGAKPSNGASPSNGIDGGLRELAAEAVRDTPEIREELVARYRELIAEGRYEPDLEKAAERMIRQGLLKDL